MKKFRPILTGILAAFVLMASISHSVSFHLCGGELQSVAVFGHARPCAEHNRGCDQEGPAAKDSSVGHKGCCEDATFIIDSDKYLSKISETVTIQAISDSLPLPNEAIALANPLAVLTRKQFFNYKPPLIEREYHRARSNLPYLILS